MHEVFHKTADLLSEGLRSGWKTAAHQHNITIRDHEGGRVSLWIS